MDNPDIKDLKSLVEAAKGGDADSFGKIYTFYYKDMYRFAFYMLQNENDAADAVSEATLDAFKGIKNLKDPEKIKSWLFTILSTKCKRHIGEYVNAPSDIDEAPEVADEKADVNETSLEIREALKKLKPLDRHIVVMHTMEGFTTKEIASSLGMNESTIRSRHKRALDSLRRILE